MFVILSTTAHEYVNFQNYFLWERTFTFSFLKSNLLAVWLELIKVLWKTKYVQMGYTDLIVLLEEQSLPPMREIIHLKHDTKWK